MKNQTLDLFAHRLGCDSYDQFEKERLEINSKIKFTDHQTNMEWVKSSGGKIDSSESFLRIQRIACMDWQTLKSIQRSFRTANDIRMNLPKFNDNHDEPIEKRIFKQWVSLWFLQFLGFAERREGIESTI